MRILDRYAPTLVCVMIALGSSSASATSVVLLTQERSISASAYGCQVQTGPEPVCGGTSDSDAAVGFDVYDSTVSASAASGASGFASQLSTVTPSLISASVHTTGSGQAGSPPNRGAGGAGSVFWISFRATEATPYSIQGSLRTGSSFAGGYGRVDVFLEDSAGGRLWGVFGWTPGEAGLREFANSGILAPGDYLLAAVAESNGDVNLLSGQATGTADFSFEFSIVPEPSTAALLGLGLALLGLRNGSRKER